MHSNSFAFPLHCQQVFLSNDPTRPGWKIVCRTDVRGRRGQLQINQSMPNIIDVGNDGDFLGLQPRVEDVEPTREPANRRRCVHPSRLDDRGQEDHEETQ